MMENSYSSKTSLGIFFILYLFLATPFKGFSFCHYCQEMSYKKRLLDSIDLCTIDCLIIFSFVTSRTMTKQCPWYGENDKNCLFILINNVFGRQSRFYSRDSEAKLGNLYFSFNTFGMFVNH